VSFELLTTTDDVRRICDAAREHGSIALDTEFLWERTYAPAICLAQVNIAGEISLIDPLADNADLTPLAEVISDDAVEVVMHAPHADLVAFAVHYGAEPTNVFDTQIAAGFTGLSAGLAYDRLVEDLTRVRLPRSESFTDWSRRPLADRQLQYAANDVIHLFDVAMKIVDRLEHLGRARWAEEELTRRFDGANRFVMQPEDAWNKVARRGKLQPQEMGVLREVAAWRERTARKRDLPVSWVMKDPTLIELARRHPADSRSLAKIRGVDSSMRERERATLIEAIERGMADPFEPDRASGPAPPPQVRNRATVAKGLVAALLRARCQDAGIAAELVGTTSDVEELAIWVSCSEQQRETRQTPQLLSGWRAEFGHELVDLVEGRIGLRLSAETPYILIDRV
jgi:ribonuclease D